MDYFQVPKQLILPEGKQWFSMRQVAQAIGRNKLTVYRWEQKKLIPQPGRVPLGLSGKIKMRKYSREQVQEIWKKMIEGHVDFETQKEGE